MHSLLSESLGPLGPFSGSYLYRRVISPGKGDVMKTELKEALRLLAKVQADPRVGPDQGTQLMKAKRELLIVARSGKLEKERLFRAVQIMATVLQQLVDGEFQR